jgi:glutaredoxin-like protein
VHVTTEGTAPKIELYWRPGCPFCGLLRRGLSRAGIVFEAHNIWEEPDAAAFVRSVAGGNETVPTVSVGGRALVNPRVRDVEELLRPGNPAGEGAGRGFSWFSKVLRGRRPVE